MCCLRKRPTVERPYLLCHKEDSTHVAWVYSLIASSSVAANSGGQCRTKKKGGSPSSKPPVRTKFASGSIVAPACIRRQNFRRRSVGCASRHERANFAKKKFAATFGGLYALPFCR